MLLLLTISTLAGVEPVAAGDNGRGRGGGEEISYEATFEPPWGTGDGYILPEPILPPNCPDERTSISCFIPLLP
jgi:hypothetical protein